MARRRAALLSMFSWTRSVSMIWKPIVKDGLRLVAGSWKIIAMSLPVSARRSACETARKSLPSNDSRRALTCPG